MNLEHEDAPNAATDAADADAGSIPQMGIELTDDRGAQIDVSSDWIRYYSRL